MARDLTLLHTAEVHVARFEALRDAVAPDVSLTHVVRQDLLDRAREHGVDDDVKADLIAALGPSNRRDRVICTCTTLGPAADAAGAIRIDRPLMQEAARRGGNILLVVVLESTVAACKAVLDDSINAIKSGATVETLLIPEVWTLFEAGDPDGFARAIAERVNATATADHSCVVLAQVSMTDAAAHIDHSVVLTAPELALKAALSQ